MTESNQPEITPKPPPDKVVKYIMIVAAVALIVGAAVMAYIGMNYGFSSPVSPSTSQPAIVVTAEKLYQDYEDNEVAADRRYEDRVVRVTGVVDSIGKDILDMPYVTLTDGSDTSWWGVQCMFADKDEGALARLSKGQTITIEGTCSGYLINVLVRGCSLQ